MAQAGSGSQQTAGEEAGLLEEGNGSQQAPSLQDVSSEARVMFIIALGLQPHGKTRDALLGQCQKYPLEDDATPALQELLGKGLLREGANGLLQVDDQAACAVRTALHELEITSCVNLSTLPPEISQLRELQQLDLTACKSLSALPPEIGQLRALQQLDLTACESLSAVPPQIGQLRELRKLTLHDCEQLSALPRNVGQLEGLQELNLSGCRRLLALPKEIENLKQLTKLNLSVCDRLSALPRELGQLTQLTSLDLSYCMKLTAVPSSITQLIWLREFGIEGFEGLSYSRPNEGDLAAKLQWFLAVMKRKAALEELATRQEPMVNMLTSMSWLVILLATATFIGFLQPPGGLDEESHLVHSSGLAWCVVGGGHKGTAQAPEQAGGRLGAGICFMWWFFIVDALSFGLSISCVMMIVVVSMPRVSTGNKYFEAGRFWLLLVLTWGLLWFAVVTGFISFLLSGLATVSTQATVLVPLVPGMFVLLAGLILMCKRLFGNLNPGPRAIRTALSEMVCCGYPLEFEDEDVEIGHQMSRDYWEQAALLLNRE